MVRIGKETVACSHGCLPSEVARAGEEKVLWALQRLDGFEGLLVLANRQNGKILIVTL